ncbi:MAG TPA: glycosyltransferase family 39 protein [Candidatus Angelobacter sp.]
MLQAAREFRIGRPQIFAGLMLLSFLAQSIWAAGSRKLSDLEYQYIASGLSPDAARDRVVDSPFTAWVASLPVRATRAARTIAPPALSSALAIPRPWLLRLPFIGFGLWLGGALWWVARRLFDDAGGYVALALYCTSPAMIMISSNIGPDIVLAWSLFGLVYTAIGVAHTLYAPPRKWAPRAVILGLALGFALSTALWSFLMAPLAFAFMIYLAPGRRRSALAVLAGASVIALAVLGFFAWSVGGSRPGSLSLVSPDPSLGLLRNLGFALNKDTDGYVLVALFITAVTAYGSWPRTRYFGNTAPLLTAFVTVVLFALVPATHLWDAALGLSFIFVFVGGVAADLLETGLRRTLALILTAGFLLRIVLGLRTLWLYWIGQNRT